MTHEEIFEQNDLSQNIVGHTHGPCDQAFSVECTALNHTTGDLQDDKDMMKVLEARVPGSRHRKRIVEKLEGAYDWKQYFLPLNVTMKGHVQHKAMTLRGEEACHYWSFRLRRNVAVPAGLEKIPTAWPEQPEHPKDVILLTKQYLCSPDFNQIMVFCPHSEYAKLAAGGTNPYFEN